ncbi:MAG: RNA methyltransferase [Phycisphaerae bacterium]|nr:RNA methyltransferase [Phycisphaerae bacterium]
MLACEPTQLIERPLDVDSGGIDTTGLDASAVMALAQFQNTRDRDLRGNDRVFIVESPRVVRRFLRSRWACSAMLTTTSLWPAFADAVQARPEVISVFLASEAAITQLSGYRFHGGALAIGRRTWHPPSSDDLFASLPDGVSLRLLVASGIVQVDNVGGLFRNASCFGVHGILLEHDCADPLLRKTIRFSMGRVFDMPWGISRDLVADIERIRARGVHVAALELTADARPVSELPRDGSIALIVGNEARGIRAEVLAACDRRYKIPAPASDEDGEQRSLNVSVASGIALYALLAGEYESASALHRESEPGP